MIKLTDFSDDAACADVDPAIFFDADTAGPALRICARCNVQAECLQYALEQGFSIGIFGGLTPTRRASMRSHALMNMRADWSETETARLRELAQLGFDLRDIARVLDRPVSSIRAKLARVS